MVNNYNQNKTTLNDLLENPQKDIGEMFEEKQATIEKQIEKKQEFIKESQDKKQNSMRDFAIKRDAAMFAVAEVGIPRFCGSSLYLDLDKKEIDTTELLKKAHEKWIKYFETIY